MISGPQPKKGAPLTPLTPQQFCQKMTSFSAQCVQKLVKKRMKNPGNSPASKRRMAFYKMLVKRFATQQATMVQRCVKGFAKEQGRRRASKKAPISGKQLAACFQCMLRLGCAKQRHCRAVCVR